MVAVTGLPGSGKSLVAQVIAEYLKLPLISMGDLVREEVKRRGLELTPWNLEVVAIELRRERGSSVVAQMLLEEVKRRGLSSEGLVVDGVRSLEEVKVLSSLGRVCVVGVFAPPRLRFERLLKRGRVGDVKSLEEFKMRDWYNLNYGIGNLLALADYMIVNDSTPEDLARASRAVAEEIRVAYENCGRGRD
ncbi:MAG: AAA family ATPase [Acidilobaceae archaeon]